MKTTEQISPEKARANRSWLGRRITNRERPENLARALAHHSEDTKVVIQFSEV